MYAAHITALQPYWTLSIPSRKLKATIPQDPCMVYMLTLGYIDGIHVTIYSIHGSYGYGKATMCYHLPIILPSFSMEKLLVIHHKNHRMLHNVRLELHLRYLFLPPEPCAVPVSEWESHHDGVKWRYHRYHHQSCIHILNDTMGIPHHVFLITGKRGNKTLDSSPNKPNESSHQRPLWCSYQATSGSWIELYLICFRLKIRYCTVPWKSFG